MPPLEDALIQVPLAHGTDVETNQDEGAPNDIEIQEDTPPSTQAAKVVDSQSSPVARVTGVNKGEFDELKDDFIRQLLADQTSDYLKPKI